MRIGVRPRTALLGVYGKSGERRTSATVKIPPSAARSASARAFGRSSKTCVAALRPRARAIANEVAALATAAANVTGAAYGPYSQPAATISGMMGKRSSVIR